MKKLFLLIPLFVLTTPHLSIGFTVNLPFFSPHENVDPLDQLERAVDQPQTASKFSRRCAMLTVTAVWIAVIVFSPWTMNWPMDHQPHLYYCPAM